MTGPTGHAGQIWRIRPAIVEDGEILAELEAAAFGPSSWGRRAIIAGITAKDVTTSLIFPRSDVGSVGFAMWRAIGDEAEILTLGVKKDFRRAGAAKALLEDVIECAADASFKRIFLEVAEKNTAAQALYAGAGFEKIGGRRGYYGDGSDAVVMSVTLVPVQR